MGLDVSITIKIDEATQERISRIVVKANKMGVKLDQSKVIRIVLMTGLPSIEADPDFYRDMLALWETRRQ
jgi:hypothetical protein